ncbi:MAG: ZIP family metal transporter [Clostridia bacterium]|nr:ZIP family metal transporter [Clostridia bacterium]
MTLVWLTALGVGGATVVGAILGFTFKNISHKFSDIVLSFAAGIMLAAAIIGLILPSLENASPYGFLVTAIGVILGAVLLNLIDKFVPHLHKMMGTDIESHGEGNERLNKVLLFVAAIAIHNLPEGIAAGVGFGAGNTSEALTVAGGIALQNIPEGMVIIGPLLASGVTKGRTFVIAALTGVVEVIGTFIGYFSVAISAAVLPFALAFAGGTMLYVISDEMIPETHAHGSEKGATFALLIGFLVMLATDFYLG